MKRAELCLCLPGGAAGCQRASLKFLPERLHCRILEWLLANYGQNTDNSIDKQSWKQDVKTWDTMPLDPVLYLFLVHSSVSNLCILTWDRYAAILHPLRYNTSIILRRPGRIILLAWLIPLLISLYLVLGMFAANSDTVLKVLRLTGVSDFDILCSTLFVYVVVRISAVIRAQSLLRPEFCYGVSQKGTANFTQAGFTEDSSFQTSW